MLFYRKDYWNKGLATEALEQVINFTFDEIGLEEFVQIILKIIMPQKGFLRNLVLK